MYSLPLCRQKHVSDDARMSSSRWFRALLGLCAAHDGGVVSIDCGVKALIVIVTPEESEDSSTSLAGGTL